MAFVILGVFFPVPVWGLRYGNAMNSQQKRKRTSEESGLWNFCTRPSGAILDMQHSVARNAYGCNAPLRGLPPDWQEFPQLGNEKTRMTGGRGANSAGERAEMQQPA
jgi:hypothetical protein